MIARTLAPATGFLAVVIALVCSFARADDAPARPDEVRFKAGEFTLTGPYTHDNLTIYLIYGNDRVKGRHYVTLADALREKMAVVHETGSVNELRIENLSNDSDLYIESGDIVKGASRIARSPRTRSSRQRADCRSRCSALSPADGRAARAKARGSSMAPTIAWRASN